MMRRLIPLSIFMALAACANEVDELEEGRLGHVAYLDGEGAVQLQGLYDRELSMQCAAREDRDGVLRCLPLLSLGPVFADAACAEPLLVLHEADPAPYIGVGEALYEVGERFEGITYAKRGERCDVVAGPLENLVGLTTPRGPPGVYGSPLVARRGTTVEPERFARITRERRDVSDRLTRLRYVAEDGSKAFAGIEDRTWQRTCAMLDANGRAYCGPGSIAHAAHFGDATCTEDPLWSVQTYLGDTEHAWASLDSCAPIRLLELGAAVETESVFRRVGLDGRCAEVPPPYPLVHATVVDPDAVLPVLSLVEEGEGRLAARHPSVDGFGVIERYGHTLYDREGAFECTPTVLDGAVVCAPLLTGPVRMAYRDAACTDPVPVGWRTMRSTARHVQDDEGVIFELTDETPAQLYVEGPSGCRDALNDQPIGAGCGQFYEVGERLAIELAPLRYDVIVLD
jgi:hypothetical protein